MSCLGGTWGSILHLVTEVFILYIEDYDLAYQLCKLLVWKSTQTSPETE